jgi:hypothetical protein
MKTRYTPCVWSYPLSTYTQACTRVHPVCVMCVCTLASYNLTHSAHVLLIHAHTCRLRIYQYYLPVYFWCLQQLAKHKESGSQTALVVGCMQNPCSHCECLMPVQVTVMTVYICVCVCVCESCRKMRCVCMCVRVRNVCS